MPEILDRDLSRPDGVRWLLSFALTAMMMLATSEKKNSEEKRDAATHSWFCERISAETGTGGQRRQRREGGAAQDWWGESLPRRRLCGGGLLDLPQTVHPSARRQGSPELDRRHSCCSSERAGKGAGIVEANGNTHFRNASAPIVDQHCIALIKPTNCGK